MLNSISWMLCFQRPRLCSHSFLRYSFLRPSFLRKCVALSCLGLLLALGTTASGFQETPQNSTEKFRVMPNELSSRAGSAIEWESDYTAALAKSQATGKPIFWYVPSVRGTFMDRQREIDRYMLAGPFSWPAMIGLINEHFIPLRATPKRKQAERFGVEVYKFIEPGILVIDSAETLQLSADRLTTLHPQWLFGHLARSVGEERSWSTLAGQGTDSKVAGWWQWVQENRWNLPVEAITELLQSDNAELELLGGMVQFVNGNQAAAKASWEATAQRHPEHPLGWKAACEAQGIGPFYRGFEVFDLLPTKLMEATTTIQTESGPVTRLTSQCTESDYGTEQLWELGTNFLLHMQDQSGGFFDSDYDFGGTDSLPNVHVAVSSLVGLALLESAPRAMDTAQIERINSAISRVADFVADDKHLNLADRDEILWAQAYRVQFLSALKTRSQTNTYLAQLQHAVRGLEAIQLANGSWYHEYANAFVTATALNALHHAQAAGAEVNRAKIELGLKRLESQRFRNGAYPYATRSPRSNANGDEDKMAASGGRISICELARRRWERIDEPQLAAAIESSLKHHELLASALKYDDHTATYEYGGFFFWYDMQARCEAIHLIADATTREKFSQVQLKLLLALPELDGCFVDSHELGRCYGTAMALLCLSHVAPQ